MIDKENRANTVWKPFERNLNKNQFQKSNLKRNVKNKISACKRLTVRRVGV